MLFNSDLSESEKKNLTKSWLPGDNEEFVINVIFGGLSLITAPTLVGSASSSVVPTFIGDIPDPINFFQTNQQKVNKPLSKKVQKNAQQEFDDQPLPIFKAKEAKYKIQRQATKAQKVALDKKKVPRKDIF